MSCCRPHSSVDARRLNQSSGVILHSLYMLMRAVKYPLSKTLWQEFSEEQVIARRDSLFGGTGVGGGGGGRGDWKIQTSLGRW